jgi:DNA repair protein RecO (recombination protein O)
MLRTTRAIVLRTVRHGERTAVLTAYTEHGGTRSYLVRVGGRSGTRSALVEPLARVEVVEHERAGRELHHLRELRIEAPGPGPLDVTTAGMLLFTQEILLRTLKGEVGDPDLFAFVHEHIGSLVRDGAGPMTAIHFLLDLSQHLGFQPSPPGEGEINFDLMEGCFVHGEALGGHTLRPPVSTALAHALLRQGQEVPGSAVRSVLLDHLLLYYRMHVAGFGELRSLDILRQVLA